MKRWREVWCGLTHGGGNILRDPLDRVNWRCCKCGRWSMPVSREDERRLIESDIARKTQEQKR